MFPARSTFATLSRASSIQAKITESVPSLFFHATSHGEARFFLTFAVESDSVGSLDRGRVPSFPGALTDDCYDRGYRDGI